MKNVRGNDIMRTKKIEKEGDKNRNNESSLIFREIVLIRNYLIVFDMNIFIHRMKRLITYF